MEERSDRFTAIEDQYAGYTVYDQHYEKIGNVDDLEAAPIGGQLFAHNHSQRDCTAF
jgi:hypothetical protein